MPGAGTDKTKSWVREPGSGRGAGRAAAWREYRRGRARHGEFRPVAAASGQAAAGLAERQGAHDGGRCRPHPRRRRAFRHARGRHRRLQLRAGHHRARPRSGQAGHRRRRGRGRNGAAHCRRRNRRHRVRPRAQRARKRRGGARRPHRHAAGQSGLRLAQSGAGGGDRRLRMVQACERQRAAVRHAAKIGAARRNSSCSRSSRRSSANWKRSSSSGRPTSARPCRSTCATFSPACSRRSRTFRRCTA